MAELSTQVLGVDGVSVTFSSADAGGDTFRNSGRNILVVKNEDASPKQVTVVAQKECNQGHLHDIVADVGAGEEYYFENLEKVRFNNDNEKVEVSYDDVTSLKVAVLRY